MNKIGWELRSEFVRLRCLIDSKKLCLLGFGFCSLLCLLRKSGSTLIAFGHGVFGEDIGFYWNMIDAANPSGSLARSGFAGTSLFIPLIIVFVIWQEYDYRAGTILSCARGRNRFGNGLAHLMSVALFSTLCYALLCCMSLAVASARGGHAITLDVLASFMGALGLNCILVISVALEALALYRMTQSGLFAGAALTVGFFASLVVYGCNFTTNLALVKWVFLLPGPYLGAGCALGFKTMNELSLVIYGGTVAAVSAFLYGVHGYLFRRY